MSDSLEAVAAAFVPGQVQSSTPLGNGHIHATFAVDMETEDGPRAIVLQRLNTQVFTDPDALMENMQRVARHPGVAAWVPGLLATPEGKVLLRTPERECWRAWERVPNTESFDLVENVAAAREIGRAFGAFVSGLADLPGPPLHATLPDFHDTAARLAKLEAAIAEDRVARVAEVRPEIEGLRRRASLTRALDREALPERVIHADTKANNVLFDRATGRAVAVVDLDTVMSGLLAWDFGDLVRSAGNAALEDEADLAKVSLRIDVFGALAEGWFETAGALMTPAEQASLAVGPQVMTYELAVRFLTDFLEGDRYFRIRDPAHNLRRTRVHLHLLASMENQHQEMEVALHRAAGA
ncbi:MAG: aminoglycoside phosphotransferase family protein [Deltaproteobacteria bacterium]|nr:aminoglycoside phosphotransferase family protein [Deltaproteobacteria bacterium]